MQDFAKSCRKLARVSDTELLKVLQVQEALGEQFVGRVWFPQPYIVLGEEAGLAVQKWWLSLAPLQQVPSYQRSAMRRPLFEISQYLSHKLGGISKVTELLTSEDSEAAITIPTAAASRRDKGMPLAYLCSKSSMP